MTGFSTSPGVSHLTLTFSFTPCGLAFVPALFGETVALPDIVVVGVWAIAGTAMAATVAIPAVAARTFRMYNPLLSMRRAPTVVGARTRCKRTRTRTHLRAGSCALTCFQLAGALR